VTPELIKRYVETGKVRFVYREFPLNSIHPAAQKASEAAVCAGQQGKYWEMNEKLFASQSEWTAQGADPAGFFKSYAGELGLDSTTFGQCLDSGEAEMTVHGEIMAGEALGVSATPYFFVNDLPIRGGLPIESLGRIIDYEAAGGPAPEIVPQTQDWHVLGNPQTALALMVAFVDYTSSESAQHAYIDTGQVVYILHPWSPSVGSLSAQAAAAAECAGQQGTYWEMHDRLFKDQATWSTATEPRTLFVGYAEDEGLDTAAFGTCLDSEWAKLRVESSSVVAALYGVPGAPVFLYSNGQGQEGSPSFDEFKSILDSILNQ
jgi:protein-disulfide isomerase